MSDIGDLKRAVLLRKTQRSVSVSGRSSPYPESSTSVTSGRVQHHLQQEELQRKLSDLNNNQSLISGNPRHDKATHSKPSESDIFNKTVHLNNKLQHASFNNHQTHADSCVDKPPRPPITKKYFSSTRNIKSERSKSTGDHPLLYTFYPSTPDRQSLRQQYCESWHQNYCPDTRDQPARVSRLEEIREDVNIKEDRTVIKERFEESSAYFSSSEIRKKTPSPDYQSSYVQLYEKHQNNPNFSFVPPDTEFSSCETSSINSSHFFPFSSDSVFSSSAAASTSTITEYPATETSTEDFSSDLSDHDPELVDEFFLFPYDVLDADFDMICDELARYSPDIEKCLHRSQKLGQLKAAKASDEWNTLWIYRGMNFKMSQFVTRFLSAQVELYIYLARPIKSHLI